MKLGDHARVTRTFSRDEVDAYQQLAGRAAGGEMTTVPEPLIGGLFSYLLGERLPGFGTNYLKQTLEFHQAAPVGQALRAEVRIERIRSDKQLVDLSTRCLTAAGTLVCSGRALVLVQDVATALAPGCSLMVFT